MILRSLVSPGRREIRVGRDMINPALHIAMHEIVANQLWADNPPEVWAIAQRLLADGYDRHEALHMLASVVTTEVFEIMRHEQPPDIERVRRALARPARRVGATSCRPAGRTPSEPSGTPSGCTQAPQVTSNHHRQQHRTKLRTRRDRPALPTISASWPPASRAHRRERARPGHSPGHRRRPPRQDHRTASTRGRPRHLRHLRRLGWMTRLRVWFDQASVCSIGSITSGGSWWTGAESVLLGVTVSRWRRQPMSCATRTSSAPPPWTL